MERKIPTKFNQAVFCGIIFAVVMCILSSGSLWAGEPPLASYVHVATPDNTKGNLSLLQHAAAGDPKAIVMVTAVLDPKKFKEAADLHPLALCWLNTAWAICNLDGKDIAPGSKFNVAIMPPGKAAFVHYATKENTQNNWTVISAPVCDGQASATVLAIPVLPAADLTVNIGSRGSIGVYYVNDSWAIYNEDRSTLSPGAAYNVIVPEGLTVIAYAGNTTGNRLVVQDPRVDGRGDMVMLATHVYNPGGKGGTYVTSPTALIYGKEAWSVVALEGNPMPDGAAFHLYPVSGKEAGPDKIYNAPKVLLPAPINPAVQRSMRETANVPVQTPQMTAALPAELPIPAIFSEISVAGILRTVYPNISNTEDLSHDPQIAAAGDSVYIIWQENIGAQQDDVFFVRSLDQGRHFEAPINLSRNQGSSLDPKIVVADGAIYVAWRDNSDRNWRVMVACSRDNGQTFAEPVAYGGEGAVFSSPVLAASGTEAYMVWASNPGGLFFKNLNGGPITAITGMSACFNPTIAAIGDVVHVAGQFRFHQGDMDVEYARSPDRGRTWQQPSIGWGDYGDQKNPVVLASEYLVAVMYESSRTEAQGPGGYGATAIGRFLMFRDSLEHGQQFINSSTRALTQMEASTTSLQPNTAAADGSYLAAWPAYNSEARRGDILCYSRLLRVMFWLGTHTSSPQNVRMALPNGATTGHQAVIYDEPQENDSNARDIYASIIDGYRAGRPFNLSNTPGNSTNARVAWTANTVYVVWQDTTGGTYGRTDIFFKTLRVD